MAGNDNLFYLLFVTYLCFILLLNVLTVPCCYAYYCTPTLFLAFLGWSRTPLGTPPYWEISLTHFLWYFHMARIILNINIEVAFEPNVANNMVILHNMDRILTIIVINY